MTGYVYCMGACIACGIQFTFNPLRVPSSSAITGTREPICQTCIVRINAKRIKLGLTPAEVPEDAYEACQENEL